MTSTKIRLVARAMERDLDETASKIWTRRYAVKALSSFSSAEPPYKRNYTLNLHEVC